LKRFIAVLILLLPVVLLSGCYKQDRYVFSDSIFTHKNEEVLFYGSLRIDGFKISLQEITETEFESANNINVIKNHNNSKHYNMIIEYKFTGEEYIKYNFIYIGKELSHNDTYQILIDITNVEHNISGTLLLTLCFSGEIAGTTEVGTNAKRVNIIVREVNVDNSLFVGFISSLTIDEID